VMSRNLTVGGLGDPQEFDRGGTPKNDRRESQKDDHGARGNLTTGAVSL
jgi:hypothetical protein